MAQKAAKTLAARNTSTLNRTLLITLGVHALYILLRIVLFRQSFSRRSLLLYILLSFPSWLVQFWFERIGRPKYGESQGELRKAGEDLGAKGLTEWMWDVLYWTYGCVVLAAVAGDWAWSFWIVVPIYSAWLAFTSVSGARDSMAGLAGAGGSGASDTQSGSKRQQKLDKRGGQKIQYR